MKEKASILPQISVSRPVSVTMLLVALLVLGTVAYSRIPVKMFPEGFSDPFLYVGISYPHRSASSQETERQIAQPLEEMLRTIKGIKNIRTNSHSSGVEAYLNFESDTDMVLAYNQTIDLLE